MDLKFASQRLLQARNIKACRLVLRSDCCLPMLNRMHFRSWSFAAFARGLVAKHCRNLRVVTMHDCWLPVPASWLANVITQNRTSLTRVDCSNSDELVLRAKLRCPLLEAFNATDAVLAAVNPTSLSKLKTLHVTTTYYPPEASKQHIVDILSRGSLVVR